MFKIVIDFFEIDHLIEVDNSLLLEFVIPVEKLIQSSKLNNLGMVELGS